MSVFTDAIKASKSFVNITGTLGIAGFVFDIVNDEVVELDGDITDHYIETGTTVQDHIALRPERVTLSGFQGEYRHTVTRSQNTAERVTEKLTTVASYLPALSGAAQSIYNNLLNNNNSISVSDVFDTGLDLYKSYRNINLPDNNQSQAFIYFEALWNARQTFTIQTPYRYYTDMAIESIRATQGAQTRDMSSFEVTFKKIRYVSTKVTSVSTYIDRSINNLQSRLKNQASALVNKGLTRGLEIVSGWF